MGLKLIGRGLKAAVICRSLYIGHGHKPHRRNNRYSFRTPMPLATTQYDLVVIGSGPAGQKAATTAAKHGKNVVLIDRADSVGGVCIHTGTIPSKAIREAVLHLTGIRERAVYGTSYAVKHDITMSDLLYPVSACGEDGSGSHPPADAPQRRADGFWVGQLCRSAYGSRAAW